MPKSTAPTDPEIPTLPNTEQPIMARPIPLAWKVFALVAVLLVVTMFGGLLFVINSPADHPDASTAPLASTTGPDMSYPGAKSLNLTDADFWPNGRDPEYKLATIGGYTTPDSVQKITEFYKTKLEGLGYKVSLEMCWSGDCGGNADITSSSPKFTIRMLVVDYPTLQAKSNSLQDSIKSKAVTGQSTILYAVNPVQPSPVPVSVPPSPTRSLALTASPIATSVVAYLGPDNRFYSNPTTLVSVAPTGNIKGSDDVTFRIDWLISDANGTRMQITTIGDQNKNQINDPIGYLEDGSGQKYLLKFDSNWVTGMGDIAHRQIIWKTDKLTTSTTEVKFVPQAGFKFKLEPIKFKVAAIAQTRPGSVSGQSAASDAHAGYRLSVPYAYFGPDSTVLMVNFNVTDMALPPPLDITHYDEKLTKSLTVRDNNGKLLNLLPTDAPRPAGGMKLGQPLTPAPNGDMVLSLDPLGASVKTVTVRLEWQQQSWEVTLPIT